MELHVYLLHQNIKKFMVYQKVVNYQNYVMKFIVKKIF